MSAALAAVVVEAKDGSRSGCCGTPACGHTVIQHGSHRGFLNNRQVSWPSRALKVVAGACWLEHYSNGQLLCFVTDIWHELATLVLLCVAAVQACSGVAVGALHSGHGRLELQPY